MVENDEFGPGTEDASSLADLAFNELGARLDQVRKYVRS
jgi:hypothetical protein